MARDLRFTGVPYLLGELTITHAARNGKLAAPTIQRRFVCRFLPQQVPVPTLAITNGHPENYLLFDPILWAAKNRN